MWTKKEKERRKQELKNENMHCKNEPFFFKIETKLSSLTTRCRFWIIYSSFNLPFQVQWTSKVPKLPWNFKAAGSFFFFFTVCQRSKRRSGTNEELMWFSCSTAEARRLCWLQIHTGENISNCGRMHTQVMQKWLTMLSAVSAFNTSPTDTSLKVKRQIKLVWASKFNLIGGHFFIYVLLSAP